MMTKTIERLPSQLRGEVALLTAHARSDFGLLPPVRAGLTYIGDFHNARVA